MLMFACGKEPTITEPHREKTSLRGFQPGLTQTGLYSHKKGCEA